MTWHDYGSGLWCLQASECAKPVAMVWRHEYQVWHAVLWPRRAREHARQSRHHITAENAMDAIDRLREGGG